MSHWSLTDYYVFLDRMVSEHKYSKTDIDYMMPFERDVLITLINDRLDKQKKDAGGDVQWQIQTEAPT